MEERIICILKSLEDSGEISEKEKDDLYPSGSKPDILKGLANLTKFCDRLLKDLTSNDYTIKGSFCLAKEFLEFNASLFMASFDIKSLFTNTLLTETLNLCVQNLYKNQTHVGNLTKSSSYN